VAGAVFTKNLYIERVYAASTRSETRDPLKDEASGAVLRTTGLDLKP